MKTCKGCDLAKPLDDFYPCATNKDGRMGKCKVCHAATTDDWNDRNRDRRREINRESYRNTISTLQSPENRAKAVASQREWRERNPDQAKVYGMVARAIIRGDLVRGPCEHEGCTMPVESHHDDYNRPLDVRWLCDKHHGELHRPLNNR